MDVVRSLMQFLHDLRWLRARLLERSLTPAQWYNNAAWYIDKHGPYVAVRVNLNWDKPQMLRRFKTKPAAQIYLMRRCYGKEWQKAYRGEWASADWTSLGYDVTHHAEE